MPVLLLRPGDGQPELGRDPVFKNVLLPLDGTPLAEQILEPAACLAGLCGAQLTLVRIIKPAVRLSYLPEDSTIEGLTRTSVLEELHQHQQQVEEQARAYLDGIVARLRQRGLRVEERVVVAEQPAAGILREAQTRGADLIALETHGRRGLKRLLLGSVADKVIRGSSVPVLVHRPLQP
jgi:nucleotide-binding universal stress UspA family protein